MHLHRFAGLRVPSGVRSSPLTGIPMHSQLFAYRQLPLHRICGIPERMPHQFPAHWCDDALVRSVAECGVLSPVLVQRIDRRFHIVDGHRRFLAAKSIGLSVMPCVIGPSLSLGEDDAVQALIHASCCSDQDFRVYRSFNVPVQRTTS